MSKTEEFFDGKTLFFVQTSSPPSFCIIFLSFEAFLQLEKDNAQNFYNYKYDSGSISWQEACRIREAPTEGPWEAPREGPL